MSDDPIDLSPLRSLADRTIEDRVVRATMREIGDLTLEPDIVAAVWSLGRSAVIAAGIIITIAGSILLRAPAVRPVVQATTWESLGVPHAVERWMTDGALDPDSLLDEIRGGR